MVSLNGGLPNVALIIDIDGRPVYPRTGSYDGPEGSSRSEPDAMMMKRRYVAMFVKEDRFIAIAL